MKDKEKEKVIELLIKAHILGQRFATESGMHIHEDGQRKDAEDDLWVLMKYEIKKL